MTFMNYWNDFKKKTGASGPLQMELSYYQWLYENGKITLEERNKHKDDLYEKSE